MGAAVGLDDPQAVRAYNYTFLACLVHDVNLLFAALGRLGLGARPLGAQAWGDGRAATISVQLGRPELGGRKPASGTLGRCTWLLLPEQEEFSKRARLSFADAIHEFRFGVPHHAQVPTEHRIQRRGEHGKAQASARYKCDTYRAELDAFIDCITLGAMNRTPPELATRDIELLRSLFVLGQVRRGNRGPLPLAWSSQGPLHRPALGELVDEFVQVADLPHQRIRHLLHAYPADQPGDDVGIGVHAGLGEEGLEGGAVSQESPQLLLIESGQPLPTRPRVGG